MVRKEKEVKCPHCLSSSTSKFGYSGEGKQRYLCNNPECAHRTFILDYTYEGCRNATKQKSKFMLEKGHSVRDISLQLGISTNTVLAEKRKESS